MRAMAAVRFWTHIGVEETVVDRSEYQGSSGGLTAHAHAGAGAGAGGGGSDVSRWVPGLSVRDWNRRHATLIDSTLAVLLLVACSGTVKHLGVASQSPGFAAGLILPLALRRRAPLVVFGVVAAVALTQWFVTRPLLAVAALLLALYTVAVSCTWLWVGTTTVILELGVIIASSRWAPAGTIFKSAVFLTGMVLACTAGRRCGARESGQSGWHGSG